MPAASKLSCEDTSMEIVRTLKELHFIWAVFTLENQSILKCSFQTESCAPVVLCALHLCLYHAIWASASIRLPCFHVTCYLAFSSLLPPLPHYFYRTIMVKICSVRMVERAYINMLLCRWQSQSSVQVQLGKDVPCSSCLLKEMLIFLQTRIFSERFGRLLCQAFDDLGEKARGLESVWIIGCLQMTENNKTLLNLQV